MPAALLTRAESSHFTETSRHADVMAFIRGLESRQDDRLHIDSFGQTPEGRELPLLVLSSRKAFTPEAAKALGLPIVLVINGIHAGEVEGKEASMMLVRDILDGRHGDLLDHLTLVVVPLFNADGNDRIDPKNRKLDIAHLQGQLGPTSGVGTRFNAAGVNLNRDYMQQSAPEMRLLQSRVCQPWEPHLTIDCHATNGSIHRFSLTYDIPHTVESGRREPIEYMRERFLPEVRAAVKRKEGRDTFWYGNFIRDEGGQGQGWITYTHHPRFGGNYRGLTNRMDLLLETYAYISFEDRVMTTYAFLRESLSYVAQHGPAMVEVVEKSATPPEEIAIRYDLQAFPTPVEVLTRDPYTLEGNPISVQVPHFGRFVGVRRVKRPRAYAVAPDIGKHLELHGLRVDWNPATSVLGAEIATIAQLAASENRTILEAAQTPELIVTVREAHRPLPSGWALVDSSQPRGAIATYLCEPESDDGLLANGLLCDPQIGSEFPVWRVHELGKP